MRIDVVSIFPDYLAPLGLSLPGKAQTAGLLDLHVHDLRDFTYDRHRTVDAPPAGGGAGMVMKPEPWGEALDKIAPDGATLVVPTPAGEPFTQRVAAELATRDHLVFACGRYEGIDQRVMDDAASRLEVRELSIGDYVLNGGEVAALAITEAVIRLLPGFMGNAESLAEESHAEGLLEYPVFTKPASWRGLDVPEALRSGDHARIARWRHAEAVRRTAERRPDLAHRASAAEAADLAGKIRLASPSDAGELLTLQRACWVQEAQANPGLHLHALHEELADVETWLQESTTVVLRVGGRVIGAARGRIHTDRHGQRPARTWDIGRIMVVPDLQGRGIGRLLLEAIEQAAPPQVTHFELVTGAGSERTIKMCRRAGYRFVSPDAEPGTFRFGRPRS